MLAFTALPGVIYGLERSSCLASVNAEAAHQQTCRIEMVEIGRVEEGG